MPTALRLGLEWFLNPDHLPFLIAEEEGWLRESGIELTLIEPAAHMDAMEEIQSGRMDLAITEPIHLIEDAAKGHAVVGFSRFLHTNGGVLYRTDGRIQRPRDMAGARIQYPGAPGPGGPAIVSTMIEADGGSCDLEKFTPVNTGFYHTKALEEDLADVATLAFFNFEVVEARLRGLPVDFFPLKDWGVPDFCQLVLVSSADRLESHREPFGLLLRSMRRAIDLIHQDPQRAQEIFRHRVPTSEHPALDAAILDATLRCFTHDMTMSRDYFAELATWMLERGLIETMVTPRMCWTNGLVTGLHRRPSL